MNQDLSERRRLWLFIILNIGLAIYATPVIDVGDANAYIKFSRSFMEDIPENFAHRSPFFSLILAGLMLLVKPPLVYKLVILLHYALVASTSWMVYALFKRLFPQKQKAFLAALIFNLSFSTIFYANLIQTEILTVFLTMLSMTLLMDIYDNPTIRKITVYSITIGILALTRFNTLPLFFTFAILLCICLSRQKINKLNWLQAAAAFLIPYFLIINAWCLYNKQHNGFYGLFPRSGGNISRNIIVASIRPGDEVSVPYKPLLDIFIKARAAYLVSPPVNSKSGFAEADRFELTRNLYAGYGIYSEARPELLQKFNLPESAGEQELSIRLSGFYKEIARQHKSFIREYRVVSFFAGFLPSSNGTLPASYGNINLNILPAFLPALYSMASIFLSVAVFIGLFFFIRDCIRSKWRFNFILMSIYLLILSFWGVNFLFITAGDAHRFKFPVEPLIIGIFIYQTAAIWRWAVWQGKSSN